MSFITCKGNMDLYCVPFASPSRSVILAAESIGVKLNRIIVNTHEQEHLKPEFLKINPQHTVPTLVDNGFSLWESRAIMVYLVEKYGKDDSLFPKDPKKQAVVNQRLHFDMGTLNQAFTEYYYPQFRENKAGDPEKFKKIEAAFDFLNTFLEGQKYVAGDHLTIADIAIITTVTTYIACDFKIKHYSNVAKWYESVQKEIPGFEENVELAKEYTARLEAARKL